LTVCDDPSSVTVLVPALNVAGLLTVTAPCIESADVPALKVLVPLMENDDENTLVPAALNVPLVMAKLLPKSTSPLLSVNVPFCIENPFAQDVNEKFKDAIRHLDDKINK
jgi:hypothetical protein